MIEPDPIEYKFTNNYLEEIKLTIFSKTLNVSDAEYNVTNMEYEKIIDITDQHALIKINKDYTLFVNSTLCKNLLLLSFGNIISIIDGEYLLTDDNRIIVLTNVEDAYPEYIIISIKDTETHTTAMERYFDNSIIENSKLIYKNYMGIQEIWNLNYHRFMGIYQTSSIVSFTINDVAIDDIKSFLKNNAYEIDDYIYVSDWDLYCKCRSDPR